MGGLQLADKGRRGRIILHTRSFLVLRNMIVFIFLQLFADGPKVLQQPLKMTESPLR